MPKINFKDIEGKEKGKIGFVCGLGPSLTPYLNKFKEMIKEKEKYVFFSCNEVDEKSGLHPDYWVFANNESIVPLYYNKVNEAKSTLVYAYSVDLTPYEKVDELIETDYIAYSERENLLKDKEETIQTFFQNLSGNEEKYSCAGTVAVHMLSTAVITGCNPIYVVGVDMDYRKGYCDGSKTGRIGWLSKNIPNLENSFRVIKESAENIGIEIYNLNLEAPYESLEKKKLFL